MNIFKTFVKEANKYWYKTKIHAILIEHYVNAFVNGLYTTYSFYEQLLAKLNLDVY